MKKIVIIGPESTGKSTLCQQLATHYQTLWCAEYAREYLETNGTNYTFEDLLEIAKGQIALEESFAERVREKEKENRKNDEIDALLFIDTDMLVMKVWCEFVFGKVHPYITDQISKRHYDLYLLCDVDLPWLQDSLREYPDLERRKQLHEVYRQLLTNQSVPWVNIRGNYTQRFELAVKAIDDLLTP